MVATLCVLACLGVPVLFFVAQSMVLDWLSTDEPPAVLRRPVRWLERHLRRRRRHEPLPPVLLALELRRLAVEIRKVEDGNQPAKAARLAASRSAYDYVLLEYCRSLDVTMPADHVPLPAHVPLSDHQRFTVEEALIGAGHDW